MNRSRPTFLSRSSTKASLEAARAGDAWGRAMDEHVRTRMHEDAIRAHLMPEGPEGLPNIRGAARTKPPGPRRAWEPA